jgi:hypothetical protein
LIFPIQKGCCAIVVDKRILGHHTIINQNRLSHFASMEGDWQIAKISFGDDWLKIVTATFIN